MEAMMAQQAAMMPMLAAAAAPPQMPEVPPVYTSPEVDWSSKIEEISNQMKTDATLDRARRVGRLDTVLTSPLLNEDEAATTTSLLTGETNA